MTDLQIKYWTLKEQERANREQELLKAEDVRSQIPLRKAQTSKTQAESSKVKVEEAKALEEVSKISAEIDKIKADTSLTTQKRNNEIVDRISKIVGILQSTYNLITSPARMAADMFKSVVGAASSGGLISN